ncbi:MAG: hypothetical protein ACYTG0_10320 [Planctomycetota bacterium]|jgi:hypothetical protein
MSQPSILRAEEYERIGTLPGIGVEVGVAVIGNRKALITWGQKVPIREIGTKYRPEDYVVLGCDGPWAERIICSQEGFGETASDGKAEGNTGNPADDKTDDKTVNFILVDSPVRPDRPTGWVACDFSQGHRVDEVRHGQLHAKPEDARREARSKGYEGVRYVDANGYLYTDG